MDDGLRLAFFMYIGTSALFAVMIGALNRAKLQRYLVCWSLYWLLLAVSYVGLYLMLRIAVEPFIGLYTVALVASVLMLHAGGRDILALTHNQRRWFVVYGLVIGTTAVLWFLPVDMAMHIVFVSWCLSFFYALTGWMFVRLQGRIQRAFSVALFFLALSVLLYGVFAGNPTVQTTLFAMNGFSGILIGLSMINLHYQQLALRDAQQTAKLLGMSYLDSLTALHNRNYYETMLNTYDHEALLPLSIIMIDLNHLKIVNDTYGHHIGDHMIKQVADWLKELSEAAVTPIRYGGDEFTVLMPNTPYDQALKTANTLMARGEKHVIKDTVASLSAGVATRTSLDETLQSTWIRAEQNMYAIKRTYHKNTAAGT